MKIYTVVFNGLSETPLKSSVDFVVDTSVDLFGLILRYYPKESIDSITLRSEDVINQWAQ